MKTVLKSRALAIILSICMLAGLLPVDMLGGVLKVQAEEITSETSSDNDASQQISLFSTRSSDAISTEAANVLTGSGWTISDPSSSLAATLGQDSDGTKVLTLDQTSQSATLAGDFSGASILTFDAADAGFADGYTISADITVLSKTKKNNNLGVGVGESAVTSDATVYLYAPIRANEPLNARIVYNKADGTYGSTNYDTEQANLSLESEYSFTFTRNTAGSKYEIYFNDAANSVSTSKGVGSGNVNAAFFAEGTTINPALVIEGTKVEIRNLKVLDAEGNELYNLNTAGKVEDPNAPVTEFEFDTSFEGNYTEANQSMWTGSDWYTLTATDPGVRVQQGDSIFGYYTTGGKVKIKSGVEYVQLDGSVNAGGNGQAAISMDLTSVSSGDYDMEVKYTAKGSSAPIISYGVKGTTLTVTDSTNASQTDPISFVATLTAGSEYLVGAKNGMRVNGLRLSKVEDVNFTGTVSCAPGTSFPETETCNVVFKEVLNKDAEGNPLTYGQEYTGAINTADGSYSLTVPASAIKKEYEISFSDTAYVLAPQLELLTISKDMLNTTVDMTILKVNSYDLTGTYTTGLGEDAANLTDLIFEPITESAYEVPATVFDAAAGTYSTTLEKGTTYKITAVGVNDYSLVTDEITYNEDTTLNLEFSKKPCYPITLRLGATPDLSSMSVSYIFTHEEGDVYEFASADGITLRDGKYTVEMGGDIAKLAYAMSTGTSLTVDGAEVKHVIQFKPVTAWSFASPYNKDINGTVGYYQGLEIDATNGHIRPNANSAQLFNGTTIKIPVTGPCTVTVEAYEPKYALYTIGGVQADTTVASTTYEYTATAAGTVDIVSTDDGAYVKTITVSYPATEVTFVPQTVMPFVPADDTDANTAFDTDGNPRVSKQDSITIQPVGQKLNISQVGGAFSGNFEAVSNVGYYVFPMTEDANTLEFDLVINSAGGGNDDGIFIGAFTNNYAYTLGIRKGTNARAIYSKGAVASGTQFAGAGGIDSTIEMGTPLHITVTPTQDGKTKITYENLETGKTESVESSVQSDVAGRYYGMVVCDANVTITNMLYKAPDGTVLYDQNACYYPMGIAPTASDVAAVAAETREYIDVTWDGTVPENDGTYVVEMSKDGGEWVELTDDVIGFSYRYEIPAGDGGNYLFRVCGQLGKETLGGDRTAYATMAESIYVKGALARPVVEISAGASSISLDWQDVAEAEYYLVYRYSFDEGAEASAQIAKVTSSEYVDSAVTAEMPYYYNVIAISEATDNQSTLSDTVWQVATPGHTGEYVYEDEATKITLTKKSYDTVYSSEVVLEGVVENAGTLEAYVNGVVAASKELGVRESFAFNLTVSEGRNDVELIFTDSEGKKTRYVYNFVYLTNYDAVVDAAYTGTDGEAVDGIPTYKTVQAAVDAMAANAETDRVILVKAGSYEERLVVNTPNISIIGEDRESTSIHYFPGNYSEMDKRCATYIQSGAKGFSAENITFANDCVYAEYPNQQDAVRCDADKASFVNVKFVGVQDTLYMHTGYQYYDKCRIEGLIDFIYSGEGARSFFNDCEIVFVYESTKTSGYTSAPKTAADATYGLTFNNCVITSEEGCLGTEYLLARPWGKDAYITWINCFMGKSINSVLPYRAMSGNAYEDARFFEFGTYGPGFAINADRRQISPAKAAEMVTDAYLGWAPQSVSDAVAAKYIGTITTTDAPSFVEKEYNADTYAWTDGDDTGLKLYDMEGYAESYGVTGGGLLKETNSNYYQVATATEFLEALIAIKASGRASVIEMTADINLGCNEVEDFDKYSDMKLLTEYSAQALTHPTLIESGVSKLNIESYNNLTIFSLNGASIKHANITMKKSNNIMIRNIKFDELWEWDEATNGDYDRNDWDYMTIDDSCNGVWIDHCTFYKAYDGIVDIKNPNPENNVTISWCEFLPGSEDNVFFDVMMDDIFANPSNYPTYMKMLGAGMTQDQIYMYAYGQKKTHLLGQSDEAVNAAGIRLTMANNYYLNSMDRMPRLRYGNAHVYNCIMDAQELLDVRLSIQNEDYAKKIVSNGAASTCGAQVLLENCYISGIQNALNSGNGSSPSGYINAVDSVYYMDGVLTELAPKANSSADDRVLVTDADAFVAGLPYSGYHLYNADDLDEILLPRVGAGKINLTVLQWEKVSYNAAYEEPAVFRAEISDTIPDSVLTEEVKNVTGCETVEELVRYLQTNVIDNELAKELLPNAKPENTSVMEIVVQISTDGGKTWVNATEDNFPEEGVDVVIPYPEGTNAADYSFVIGHLITMGCNGMKVGEMEFFSPQEIGKGLQIHIMSASPFVVAWEKAGEQAPIIPEEPGNTENPENPEKPENPDAPVVDGDDSDSDDDDDDSAELPESQGTTSPKTYDESAYVPAMVPEYTEAEDEVEELPADVVVVAAPTATNNNYWIIIAIAVAAVAVIISRFALLRKEEEE